MIDDTVCVATCAFISGGNNHSYLAEVPAITMRCVVFRELLQAFQNVASRFSIVKLVKTNNQHLSRCSRKIANVVNLFSVEVSKIAVIQESLSTVCLESHGDGSFADKNQLITGVALRIHVSPRVQSSRN
ncbi:MAG: hypothetical protein U0R19_24615 [Bryobacteraceae bacterium]